MNQRFTLFRRGGVFYAQDSTTGKQTSLRTKDEAEARTLLHARNESFRQPVLNLQIARTYLTASDPRDANYLHTVLPELFKLFRFSLRTQEQCFTQLAIAIRTTPKNHYLCSFLLAFMICLRNAARPLYERCTHKLTGPDEILDHLRSLPGGPPFLASVTGACMEAHLVMAMADRRERSDRLNRYQELARATSGDEVARNRALDICNATSSIHAMVSSINDIPAFLHRKIEMAHRFVQDTPEAAQ